jgi:hypothetical protein
VLEENNFADGNTWFKAFNFPPMNSYSGQCELCGPVAMP